MPSTTDPVLLREDREGIATLTLNRPAQMNLLTTGMLAALHCARTQGIGQKVDCSLLGGQIRLMG